MKHLFRIWVRRQITPIGKVAILKSLILSKLIYLWILLPNPPNNFFQDLQSYCYRFVWNNKKDKISRKTSHKSVKNGGIGLPELKTFANTLKLTWLRKLLTTNHKWKAIANSNFPHLNNLSKYGPEIVTTFSKANVFWTEVFNVYKEFFYKANCTNSSELLAEPVFFNNRIQIGKKCLAVKTWINKGIHCIANFVLENGNFMSYEEFKLKHNVHMDFVTFAG